MAVHRINQLDVVNAQTWASKTYGDKARVEMIWLSGTDPFKPTLYFVVNKGDGVGNQYVPCYGPYDFTAGGTHYAGLNITAGTAVAANYSAVDVLSGEVNPA